MRCDALLLIGFRFKKNIKIFFFTSNKCYVAFLIHNKMKSLLFMHFLHHIIFYFLYFSECFSNSRWRQEIYKRESLSMHQQHTTAAKQRKVYENERKYLHDCISIHHEIDSEREIIYFSSSQFSTVTTERESFVSM